MIAPCCQTKSWRQHALIFLLTCALVDSVAAQSDPLPKPFQFEGATKIQYKQVGDHQLYLHVFKPPRWTEQDRCAAIVFFFGGGWVGGTPGQFVPQCRHLAERGMVAITAEYRVRSRHGCDPPDCVADGKSAVRWVRQHARELGVDSQRIAVAGGSAGGHVAASTATLQRLPEEEPSGVSCQPNALVLFNPVIDTTARGYGAKRLGDRAVELSPVHHVTVRMPPTLVFHGEADQTVPYENAARFQRLMAENGNACQLVSYPGAGHGFFNQGRKASQYEDTLRRTDDFLTATGFLAPASLESRVAGRTFNQWAEQLKSSDVTAQRRAALTIGLFGKAVQSTLLGMLDHQDASVRYWAASSVGDLAPQLELSDRQVTQLQGMLADPNRGPRMAAAYALARCGHPQNALTLLRQVMESGKRGDACTAAELLGKVGARAEVDYSHQQSLLARMKSEQAKQSRGGDYHIRGAIKNAIRKIAQDQSLENHVRPKGGQQPRAWRPSEKVAPGTRSADKRPNILWISCEDISPNLGCYGDAYASTPHLDALARQGARFERAFTPAGVCAVVRSGIITGVYPISLGSQHMRSRIVLPDHIRCFTEYLRAAGYFCTNKSKTDYQFNPPQSAWDRQGNTHNDWRDRAPDQPFFSVINLTVSHESQIRHGEQTHQALLSRLDPEQHHEPDLAAKFLPPIYPNTPEARKDWAWYADNISEMDRQAGLILKQLAEDGLADNTVVVFWSDHGRGLPRGKRWIYDSGVHIPLIVRWPGQVKAGSVREDLVSTQDLAPTMLALAGVDPQPHMHGRVFLGDRAGPEPEFLFFHRDRMDEAYELMRAARDHRFKYIRNYQPAKTYAQHIEYMDKMPTLVDLRRMHAAGELTHVQGRFFRRAKPIEELYDLEKDPHETVNLAWLPEYAERIATMRQALEQWQVAIGDKGMVPEPVLIESMGK